MMYNQLYFVLKNITIVKLYIDSSYEAKNKFL